MKANAPDKIYLFENPITETPYDRWLSKRSDKNDIEYIQTNAFIEKAAEFLYNYNQKQALKHGARATLGCGEYTINVDEFRKYMKGEYNMADVIEVNGMKFEKTRLIPNFQGVYASDPCPECDLDIHWVDYGGECLCGKIDCARINRKDPHVWCIVGGLNNLKTK